MLLALCSSPLADVLQIWPELYTSKPQRPWHGPPLLTHKVITLLRLLEADRQRCIKETADRVAAAGGGGGCSEDWWSTMVFVETKVGGVMDCDNCVIQVLLPPMNPHGYNHVYKALCSYTDRCCSRHSTSLYNDINDSCYAFAW